MLRGIENSNIKKLINCHQILSNWFALIVEGPLDVKFSSNSFKKGEKGFYDLGINSPYGMIKEMDLLFKGSLQLDTNSAPLGE